jgi:hypothetical protein
MNTIVNSEVQKTLPQLVKGSSIYKLIVPEKVEEKIRYLLRKFPSTEWSGVLFTTHQGSFEENNLVITCEDIYPMDLGNSTYTEFKMSEDVAAYMAENIELFDCDLQLVHSHHVMSTHPSGTDLQTLREEGNERNCFVSLIVNNAGTYYAAITRKVQTKSEVTVKSLGTSYEFFGEGTKEITHDGTETTKTIDKEVIQYFDLEIERHEVSNSLSYLDVRFDEIQKKKQQSFSKGREVWSTRDSWYPKNTSSIDNFFDQEKRHQDYKQLELFKGNETLSQEDEEKINAVSSDWEPNPKKIQLAVIHILTCSFITSPKGFDLKGWVEKYMDKIYSKIFKGNDLAFNEWRDFVIQYTIDHFDDETAPIELLDDYDTYQSIVAQALIGEMSKYIGGNSYVQNYCNTLEEYILI